jgi:hypothetical protein
MEMRVGETLARLFKWLGLLTHNFTFIIMHTRGPEGNGETFCSAIIELFQQESFSHLWQNSVVLFYQPDYIWISKCLFRTINNI